MFAALARRLQKLLLDLRTTPDVPLRDRIVGLDAELLALEKTIDARESELNAILYRLHVLPPEEVAMVAAEVNGSRRDEPTSKKAKTP